MLSLSAIDLPPGWQAAALAALGAEGVVMVLGGPDCGKSTFCGLVLGQALTSGEPTAWIDADLGQSHLGPPATLGLNIYPPHAPDDSGLFPDSLYFIGQTSPPGKMLELVVGLRHLVETARSRGCQRLILNTSGFISGPLALRLKLAKAEGLEPVLGIGLQRDQELEPILRPLRQFCPKVLTLPVSGQAQIRFYAQRYLYRQQRFAAYFASGGPRPMHLDNIIWLGFPFGQGPPLPQTQQQRLQQSLTATVLHAELADQTIMLLVNKRLTESEVALACQELEQERICWVNWGQLASRLVGLLDAKLLCLGLGLLLPSPWEQRQIILHTPLTPARLERVKFCRLGKLRLNPDGQELPMA